MFDPAKYHDRIEESRERIEISASWHEPDRVPIHISTGGSFYSRLFGYNIRDYYTDPDVCMDVQLKGLEWAYEELQDDRTGYGLHLDFGPIGEGLYFDLPDRVPGRHLAVDREALETPAADRGVRGTRSGGEPGPRGRRTAGSRSSRRSCKRRGIDLPAGGGLGIHPPLSCACALADPELIFTLMAEEPELIHRFFAQAARRVLPADRLARRRLRAQDRVDRPRGRPFGVRLERDVPGVRLPVQHGDLRAIRQEGTVLHADGPNDHHFEMYANDMKLTSMDIGGFSDIANAKPALHGKTRFSGGLNCRDLYYDLETAKPVIDRAIRIGAPGGGFTLAVGGETYVGVNPDTLVRAVAYAKEAGKY